MREIVNVVRGEDEMIAYGAYCGTVFIYYNCPKCGQRTYVRNYVDGESVVDKDGTVLQCEALFTKTPMFLNPETEEDGRLCEICEYKSKPLPRANPFECPLDTDGYKLAAS